MMETCRLGIFGCKRGFSYADNSRHVPGLKVTAVCDMDRPCADNAANAFGAKCFYDFDEFIESGLFDAVVLCNFFCEHTPFAIKAMEHGIDVLSETTPSLTIGECVALCRTVERTRRKYMLAENYPFMLVNGEMKRLYDSGKLGRVLYAEGEYVHPATANELNSLAPGMRHWRNWLPKTYYLTHALAPLLYMTGSVPKAVNSKIIGGADMYSGTSRIIRDAAGLMMVETDTGALLRVFGTASWGGHGNSYRLCCTKGSVENIRGTDELYLHYNGWNTPEGENEIQRYVPTWESNGELAEKAGHGGGDFWVMYHFGQYELNDVEPFFTVYRAVSMSAVGILALRSAFESGNEYEIPDFRDEAKRAKYENDNISPFPDENMHVDIWPTPNMDKPSVSDIAEARAYWKANNLCEYN